MFNNEKWKDDVGEVFLSDVSECFWMLPERFFLNTELCFTSPWFRHEGEKWCLVKVPGTCDKKDLSVYLWKKIRHTSPNHSYNFKVWFYSFNTQNTIASLTFAVTSDFGGRCDILFQNIRGQLLASNGLIKMFFEIRKDLGEDFIISPSITATDAENDDSKNEDDPEIKDELERKGVDRLLQNLQSLMLDEQSSDVLLKVEDREFKVHKNILKVRSPVFASMFQPHTKESTTSFVDIPDCSSSAFEIFLLYTYTGSVNSFSSDNMCDLYYIADKYEMKDLKLECVEFMENNLSVENFCEIVILCFQHCESHLQKSAIRFFCENVKMIIKTVQWQNFLKDYPTQANELYIKAVNA